MANPRDQSHNFTLPQPYCYLPVPLLEEKEVVTFVNAMGATDDNGAYASRTPPLIRQFCMNIVQHVKR